MTTVQVDRSGTWEDIDYSDFSITTGTSDVQVAPTASVLTQARESISANQGIRIRIDGTTRFEGVTTSAGTKRRRGQVELPCQHDAAALFSERVDVTQTGTITDFDVAQAALNNADRGGNFSLSWGTTTQLDSDYVVTNRKLSDVFRDMVDRVGFVWWVDPAGGTITAEPPGDRGTWQSLDAQADGVEVRSFDEGSVETVRNDVTVTATGDVAVSATATDSTSISTYGRRSVDINLKYALNQTEAQAYADQLLIPDPLAQGEIVVPANVGTPEQPLANFTVDLTDTAKDISETGLLIEQQTIEQGRVTLKIGEGSGTSIDSVNRSAKSQDDKTGAGTVFTRERIAAGTLTADEIDTLNLDTNELTIGADADGQIQFSVTTVGGTDILDMNPTGPDLVRLGQADNFDTLGADTITGESVTLSGNFRPIFATTTATDTDLVWIDDSGTSALRPTDDNVGKVGVASTAWSEMHSYAFIDSNDGELTTDGSSVVAGLADGHGPPDHAAVADPETGEQAGWNLSTIAREAYDICREQQRVIEQQADRIDALEARLDALESGGGNA